MFSVWEVLPEKTMVLIGLKTTGGPIAPLFHLIKYGVAKHITHLRIFALRRSAQNELEKLLKAGNFPNLRGLVIEGITAENLTMLSKAPLRLEDLTLSNPALVMPPHCMPELAPLMQHVTYLFITTGVEGPSSSLPNYFWQLVSTTCTSLRTLGLGCISLTENDMKLLSNLPLSSFVTNEVDGSLSPFTELTFLYQCRHVLANQIASDLPSLKNLRKLNLLLSGSCLQVARVLPELTSLDHLRIAAEVASGGINCVRDLLRAVPQSVTKLQVDHFLEEKDVRPLWARIRNLRELNMGLNGGEI